jgi:transcriptional regulator with XRE-family HTH domain
MKERLVQLLDLEQLTPSKFADIIGVQRSSVSHVISGRNKPSFDFLQKTLKAFPGLNAEWLMLGEGTMYAQMGRISTGTLFDAPDTGQSDTEEEAPQGRIIPEEVVQQSDLQEDNEQAPISLDENAATGGSHDMTKEQTKIIKVVLLYGDGTFSTFEPS